MKDEVIRIPPTDKWLGSCPECGKPIWESYKTISLRYKCIECKQSIAKEDIIPF